MRYHSDIVVILTFGRDPDWEQYLVGSLTGAVALRAILVTPESPWGPSAVIPRSPQADISRSQNYLAVCWNTLDKAALPRPRGENALLANQAQGNQQGSRRRPFTT